MSKRDEKVALAWVGAFFTIIGFLIVLLVKKEDDYAMFYAKQGFVTFLFFVAASILSFIPIVKWIFWAFAVILWAMSWINALSEEKRSTFIVGSLAEKIKI